MRKSGVLLHISSLPNKHGIGSLGKCAKEFIDFLKKAGQSYWQILPICPTSYGDSPYQSFCIYAGNPYFIDLDELRKQGLLKKGDYENINYNDKDNKADYKALYNKRYPILRKAYKNFLKNIPDAYYEFIETNAYWLDDYSLFMVLKDINKGKSWLEWDNEYRNKDEEAINNVKEKHFEGINFYKVIQYLFFDEWYNLLDYAHINNVEIIGDLPIYVALDSVDVWAHPEYFQLDENKVPKEIAGCPPDYFSSDGQLWGNPLYNWERIKEDNYAFWISKIDYLTHLYDVLRIDHFRGFDSYYAIPYGNKNARIGEWKKGPGIELFIEMEKQIGKKNIIAEDLGILNDSVRELLKESGFPGMRVLEFAFDSKDNNENLYLPHFYIKNCVAYTGTHDNETINGWFKSINKDDKKLVIDYLRLTKEEPYNWGMMRVLWRSVADTTIVQAQDLLGFGNEARMNIPSSTGDNWKWRAKKGDFNDQLAKKLYYEMKISNRLTSR